MQDEKWINEEKKRINSHVLQCCPPSYLNFIIFIPLSNSYLPHIAPLCTNQLLQSLFDRLTTIECSPDLGGRLVDDVPADEIVGVLG